MSESMQLGLRLSFGTLAPFALMLLSVAILPFVAGRWFHRNLSKATVAAVLGVPTVAYLLAAFGHLGLDATGQMARDYVSFMVLLFALFTISGGIFLAGDVQATPRTNLAFLAGGAVLANVIGTMGASMVLIHPLLRINTERGRVKHTDRLLHIPGVQRRRTAHSPRPPALPGLSARGALHLDVRSVAGMALGGRPHAGGLFRPRHVPLPPGARDAAGSRTRRTTSPCASREA